MNIDDTLGGISVFVFFTIRLLSLPFSLSFRHLLKKLKIESVARAIF